MTQIVSNLPALLLTELTLESKSCPLCSLLEAKGFLILSFSSPLLWPIFLVIVVTPPVIMPAEAFLLHLHTIQTTQISLSYMQILARKLFIHEKHLYGSTF